MSPKRLNILKQHPTAQTPN